MECLGVKDRSEMMQIRMECLPFGKDKPTKNRNTGEFDIPKEVLVGLTESNFTVSDMSKILSVSESTIYRKFRTYNISKYQFDDIEDHILDQRVSEITAEFPRCGEGMLRQILRKKGTKVRIHEWGKSQEIISSGCDIYISVIFFPTCVNELVDFLLIN